jgi:hypothetical protein
MAVLKFGMRNVECGVKKFRNPKSALGVKDVWSVDCEWFGGWGLLCPAGYRHGDYLQKL